MSDARPIPFRPATEETLATRLALIGLAIGGLGACRQTKAKQGHSKKGKAFHELSVRRHRHVICQAQSNCESVFSHVLPEHAYLGTWMMLGMQMAQTITRHQGIDLCGG